ncbi:MAG: hypothetical protein IKE43_07905 [Coriobacteriales bacterium]|nr:hypothetical protein [Coriobacteriales bacterium]
MSSYFATLPSFATDYSGFISVMHGLGGLMIVHDPSGCLGNYTNTDEPRWYHEPQPVFSSTLKEIEAVIGDTEIFMQKALPEVIRRKPPFVCIFGTPVSALTGYDIDSLAQGLEQRSGATCFGIETDGFAFYDDGIKRALLFAYEKLMEPKTEQVTGRVNVLGMTPLDYHLQEKDRITAYLEANGWQLGAFLGMGNSLECIHTARNAELNLVMSASALPLARLMQSNDGIPFVAGPPFGAGGIAEIGPVPKDLLWEANTSLIACAGKNVLIIGEQLCSCALRQAIQHHDNRAQVTVASFFALDSAYAQPQDVHLRDEEALLGLLNNGLFDTVIGDPLFEQLCTYGQTFVARPHPAVSSRLHWKEPVSWVG